FLTVRETLQCYQKLFENPEKLDTLIARCNLSSILGNRNNQLSGGQQQRLMLAVALVNRPKLIFLDEPSTGLDPQSRRYLWEIVEDIKNDGKTIVMTTHSMEEAEFLCDTIAIVDEGVIIAEGSPAELISTYCKTSTITLPLTAVTEKLPTLSIEYRIQGNSLAISSPVIEKTLKTLMAAGIDLTEMVVDSPDLEDVFLHLTGKKLRD
ncbi:MAG: ABC transporter ATP-binding protein, partial [Desulfocapsaceae bacterium]|nr:ABC transporter ATP-binding protein [Desulfocapsaceae bacterium]